MDRVAPEACIQGSLELNRRYSCGIRCSNRIIAGVRYVGRGGCNIVTDRLAAAIAVLVGPDGIRSAGGILVYIGLVVSNHRRLVPGFPGHGRSSWQPDVITGVRQAGNRHRKTAAPGQASAERLIGCFYGSYRKDDQKETGYAQNHDNPKVYLSH